MLMYHRAWSFAMIAVNAAELDPGRAAVLLAEIPRIMGGITDPDSRANRLAWIAKSVAEIFPDEAEQIVNGIQPARAGAFTDVAEVIAARNPAQSMTLLSKAQRAARSVTDPDYRAYQLGRVVEVRIARAIASTYHQALALTTVAWAIAGRDTGKAEALLVEAEHLADTVSEPGYCS
jgi:hypothetical protein